jgi:hypothetical protein
LALQPHTVESLNTHEQAVTQLQEICSRLPVGISYHTVQLKSGCISNADGVALVAEGSAWWQKGGYQQQAYKKAAKPMYNEFVDEEVSSA